LAKVLQKNFIKKLQYFLIYVKQYYFQVIKYYINLDPSKIVLDQVYI